MIRRGFDDTLTALKAHLLDQTSLFFDRAGASFDLESYENQASFDLDDCVRELAFFGADVFPTVDHPPVLAPAILVA